MLYFRREGVVVRSCARFVPRAPPTTITIHAQHAQRMWKKPKNKKKQYDALRTFFVTSHACSGYTCAIQPPPAAAKDRRAVWGMGPCGARQTTLLRECESWRRRRGRRRTAAGVRRSCSALRLRVHAQHSGRCEEGQQGAVGDTSCVPQSFANGKDYFGNDLPGTDWENLPLTETALGCCKLCAGTAGCRLGLESWQ